MSTAAALLVIAAIAGCPAGTAPHGAERASPAPSLEVGAPDLAPIWNDPVFQRSIVGGFGISSDVEPRISADDLALLELLRQLLPDELPAAEQLLRETVKSDTSAVFDLTLGGICFQQEKLDQALASYRTAVAKFPSFRRAYRSIGQICTRKGQFGDAIAAFNRMIELGGADSYSYGLLGYCHASLQDFQPAEAAYRTALLLQPENVEWRLGLTRCVFKQAKYEDAAALLDVLIAAYPQRAEFWLLQAHTFLGLKQPMKAAVNLEAMDAAGKSSADSLGTLGDIYVTEALPDLALSAYERGIARDPSQPPARAIRCAETLAARGYAPQSRAMAERILTQWSGSLADQDRRRMMKLRARLDMAGGSQEPAALDSLREVIALDPLDGEALMMLGQYHVRAGEPDEAILQYERAARIDAYAAPAKVKIAQILVGMGRLSEALPLLREAQSLRPREDVARYMEQVERAVRSRR